MMHFYKYLLIYLRGRKKEIEKEREISHPQFIPQMSTKASTGPVQSWEPGTQFKSPIWAAGTQFLESSPAYLLE